VSATLDAWAYAKGVTPRFIRPGKAYHEFTSHAADVHRYAAVLLLREVRLAFCKAVLEQGHDDSYRGRKERGNREDEHRPVSLRGHGFYIFSLFTEGMGNIPVPLAGNIPSSDVTCH
jgi:hypothetical protein